MEEESGATCREHGGGKRTDQPSKPGEESCEDEVMSDEPRTIEYLIRAATGSDWDLLEIPRERLLEVLMPASLGGTPVEGAGHVRFSVETFEVSVSAEDPGWHVVIAGDGSPATALHVATSIEASVRAATGVATRLVQVGGFESG